jgi:hypothetical protein
MFPERSELDFYIREEDILHGLCKSLYCISITDLSYNGEI